MLWGMEFDFKIHWKQLALSLPSPTLFHLPLAFTACVRLLLSLTSGVSLQSCCFAEPEPKACTEIVINQIVPNHRRALKQIRGKGMSLMTSLETGTVVMIVVKLLKLDKTLMQTGNSQGDFSLLQGT